MTAEADAALDRGTQTAQALREFDVTRRILLETLRRYLAASGLPRTVAKSFEFSGYTVPAGAWLIVGNTVAHHLPECFPNPERFDFERYTPGREEDKQPGAFAPFGLGIHRCLGSNFAAIQIMLAFFKIVREVELGLDPPGYKLKIKHIRTSNPAPSLNFRVLEQRWTGNGIGHDGGACPDAAYFRPWCRVPCLRPRFGRPNRFDPV